MQTILDTAAKLHLLEAIIDQEPLYLTRRIQRIVGDRATAEDLSQEVLVRALRGLPDFRGGTEQAQLRHWLAQIARNLAYNYLRDRGRHPEQDSLEQKHPDGVPLAERLPTHNSDPELISSRAETCAYLTDLIHQLPETIRIVFLLREIEGLSTTATASALHISTDLVKWRLHRARKLLKQQLLANTDYSFSA